MRKTVEILGVNIDALSMGEAVDRLMEFLDEDRTHPVYTPNAEIIMAAYRDKQFADILNKGDMVTADGAGVVLAAGILGRGVPQKVSGIDLVRAAMPLVARNGNPVYLLGGKPGVAEAAARNLESEFPGLNICGYSHGYFTPDMEKGLIDDINRSGAMILLVGLGAPRQEKWIHDNRNRLKARVCIGVGGTLDILSGRKKLAPEYIRRCGLEWLYRLCKEPWRFRRMTVLPLFVGRVVFVRISSFFR